MYGKNWGFLEMMYYQKYPGSQCSLSHRGSKMLLEANAIALSAPWHPIPLCLPSTCSPAQVTVKDMKVYLKIHLSDSLGAPSCKFEEFGEQLPTGCFSCPCNLVTHGHFAFNLLLLSKWRGPSPDSWGCVWEHTACENRVVIFNQLLPISKMCTLIIHLIYLGWYLSGDSLVHKDLIVSEISGHHERALGKNSSSFPLSHNRGWLRKSLQA